MSNAIEFNIDRLTRYVHIRYKVPDAASDLISVSCSIKNTGENFWSTASVWPHISETAMSLMPDDEWREGIYEGVITERNAAGLFRTVVWNPFVQRAANFVGDFKITLYDANIEIVSYTLPISLNNQDVVLITDWSNVHQKDAVQTGSESDDKWLINDIRENGLRYGDTVLTAGKKGFQLPRLTCRLNLEGPYAIFVSLPTVLSSIELRLTGDYRVQKFEGGKPLQEQFWKTADMIRNHMVIKQPWNTVYEFEEEFKARLDSIRLGSFRRKNIGNASFNLYP